MHRSGSRYGGAVALVVAVVAAWFVLSSRDDEPSAPPSAAADPAAAATVTASRPLEPVGARDAAVDAAPPEVDAALSVEHLKTSGVLGRPLDVSLAYLETLPWWRPVANAESPTFESEHKVRMALVVEEGRVVGAQATFPKEALSAAVPTMSSALIGLYQALPGGPVLQRSDPASPTDRSGVVETTDGRTYFWRAKLRSGEGEGPWGPEWFEIRTTPFPPPANPP